MFGRMIGILALFSLLSLLPGCGAGSTATIKPDDAHKNDIPAKDEHKPDSIADNKSDSHGKEGHTHVAPHGGVVNSVADYHVELVNDPKLGQITVYILDEDGKTPKGIDAKAIPFRAKVEGAEGFLALDLLAIPDAKDATTASKFEGKSPELMTAKSFEGFLRINHDGKSYRTAFQVTPGKTSSGLAYKCPMGEHPKLFSKPGECDICRMPLVEFKDGKVAHSDHHPKHGGTFFMAADNWHHLEGTMPTATDFRLYMYDNFTKPIAADSYEGTADIVRLDGKGEEVGKHVKLPLQPVAGKTYLAVNVPADYAFPLLYTVRVTLRKDEMPALFNFTFDKPTLESAQ